MRDSFGKIQIGKLLGVKEYQYLGGSFDEDYNRLFWYNPLDVNLKWANTYFEAGNLSIGSDLVRLVISALLGISITVCLSFVIPGIITDWDPKLEQVFWGLLFTTVTPHIAWGIGGSIYESKFGRFSDYQIAKKLTTYLSLVDPIKFIEPSIREELDIDIPTNSYDFRTNQLIRLLLMISISNEYTMSDFDIFINAGIQLDSSYQCSMSLRQHLMNDRRYDVIRYFESHSNDVYIELNEL